MVGNAEEIVKWLFTQDREKVFDVTPHKEKRSLNQNALLWECLGQMASALREQMGCISPNAQAIWDIYIYMREAQGC